MPYYPEKNLIFIHIPKTAGGAIEDLLGTYKAPGRKTLARRLLARLAVPQDPFKAYIPGHSSASWHRRVLGADLFDHAIRFAVVRNPYDRLISMYEFIRQTPRHHRHERARAQDFAAFLRASRLAQSAFLVDRSGVMLVEHVIHFEALQEELDPVLKRAGVEQELSRDGRLNSSEKRARDFYLTEETLGIINGACEDDFRLFGYSKEGS